MASEQTVGRWGRGRELAGSAAALGQRLDCGRGAENEGDVIGYRRYKIER